MKPDIMTDAPLWLPGAVGPGHIPQCVALFCIILLQFCVLSRVTSLAH